MSGRYLALSAISMLSMFVASALLFLIEPIVAKRILPVFGGASAIWNVCLVFFQIALLIGYILALLLTRFVTPYLQPLAVLILFTLPFIGLGDLDLNYIGLDQSRPYYSLFLWLSLTISSAFIALASVTTLVQYWFSCSSHPRAKKPYYLYAASNLGSAMGLIFYPFFFERYLGLSHQLELWSYVYIFSIGLVVICAIAFIGLRSDNPSKKELKPSLAGLKGYQRNLIKLLLFSAVPAGILIGVSGYIQTDIGSLPLLWVVPLFLYLSSFVLAFALQPAGHQALPDQLLRRIAAFFSLVIIVAFLRDATAPALVLIVMHLIVLFIISLLCHKKLAELAPATTGLLPVFYIAIALGGALGGLGALLLGPLIFSRAFEYPLLLACAFILLSESDSSWLRARVFLPGLILLLGTYVVPMFTESSSTLTSLLVYIPASILAYSLVVYPKRYGAALILLLLAGSLIPSQLGTTLLSKRSFYGAVRIIKKSEPDAYAMLHGSTVHGQQLISTRSNCTASAYYSASSPLGEVLSKIKADKPVLNVGVIGLGVGSIVCYARKDDSFTFFELSPLVKELAQDLRYFTLLKNAPSDNYQIIVQDGRAGLKQYNGKAFDLLIIDAFSSDAIPVHLLTQEALLLYKQHLREDGLILFHISNRFFNLGPEISALANQAGESAWIKEDLALSPEQQRLGNSPSIWSVIGESPILSELGFVKLQPDGRAPWSDDLSDPLRSLEQIL